jgi:hypothetical protein
MAENVFDSLAQYRAVRARELHAFFGVAAREVADSDVAVFASLRGDMFAARTGSFDLNAALHTLHEFAMETKRIEEERAKLAAIPPHWHVTLRVPATTTSAGVLSNPVLLPGQKVEFVGVGPEGPFSVQTNQLFAAKDSAVCFTVITPHPVREGQVAMLVKPPAGVGHEATVIAVA